MMNRRQLVRSMAVGTFALTFDRGIFSALGVAQTSQQKPADANHEPAPLQVTKLTDNLHVISGAGGNIAVLKGSDETIVIDTGLPEQSANVLKAIASISAAPIRTVINTHWHFDHTGGNEALSKVGARFLAHENTRKRCSTDIRIDAFNRTFSALPPPALPSLTFSEGQTMYANGEEIRMFHVPPAHTDTDIAIFFANANVLHTGDLLFNGFYPFIDYWTQGWLGGVVAAKEKLLALVDAKTKIIPGHGPMATRDDLKAAHDMLATVYDRFSAMAQAGKTVDEVVAAKPTADLDVKWAKGSQNGDGFTRIAYTGILRHNGKA